MCIDERSGGSLSLLPAGSFRLYIHDAFGLAFLYDPVLLESPDTTYVIEWSEATSARTTKTYITEAREKHVEMHTFMYTPRKVRTCYESGGSIPVTPHRMAGNTSASSAGA